jgi:undecaprenyl diphosphate synthase
MKKMDNNLPGHLAIIPDGNRRWAKERGLKPWEGHSAGAMNLEKLIVFAQKKGIECLSFWGSSVDNLKKRPLLEKKALLEIYREYFSKLLDNEDIHKNKVKINFIGRWREQFPDSLKKILNTIIEKTKDYKKSNLNFMLAYSGIDEMKEAVKKIQEKYARGTKITEKMIKENLMTNGLPAVDFIVRTGGEPHLSSGFMMWDSADAQLYFSDENFPDFNEGKLEMALLEYAARRRRFGV